MDDKIIIFGAGDDAERIKKRLKQTVRICGTVDLEGDCWDASGVNQLVQGNNNALILVFSKPKQKDLFDTRVGINCSSVVFSEFENTTYTTPIDGFAYDTYTGLILGMSHSQCAIDPSKLSNKKYFSASAPSMDLFLQWKYLQKLVKECPEKLQNMESVIFEMPYYIFNYDLSLFGAFTLTKFKYFDAVGDFHHYIDQAKITQWRSFIRLFDPPEPSASVQLKGIKGTLRRMVKYPIRLWRIVREKHNVWDKYYEKTNSENAALFREILNTIREAMPKASLTVLVMPFNPVFRMTHKESVSQRKKDFLNSLVDDIKLIDDFEYFHSTLYFDDHCHLNNKGGDEYTKHLDALLNQESS